MAFSLQCNLEELEYRACRAGKSQSTGNPWMSLVFEDIDAQQIECSVPQDMQGDVMSLGLRRGDVCNIAIRAVARADGSSYIQLRAVPEILEEDED